MLIRHFVALALCACLVLLTIFSPRPGIAQSTASAENRTLHAEQIRQDEALVLDGVLDEPFWERIAPATDFVQQDPVEGARPSQRTEVRIAQDGASLIIGAIMFDDEPHRILAYQRRRNAFPYTDDRFMLIIDTFGDGRNAYFFEVNPAGLMGDGLLSTGQGSELNKSWDGIWNARVARGPYGWSAEIRIPLRTMNFNAENEAWGINFQRTIRRNHEDVIWSGHRRNQGLYRPQHAGTLLGVQRPSQGIGLEVKPYAVAGSNRVPAVSRNTYADAGLDLSYNITPNLRGALTLNTDFAETEVDDRQVNLSRFPLYFPERRDFFLEGSHIFEFAPASGITPFFSRRIGLEGGVPVPIHAGARIVGQMGRTDVGILQVRTGREDLDAGLEAPGEDFTVARLRQSIFDESMIGIIYTRRSARTPNEPGDHHTLGTDLELQTSRFLGDRNLQFQAYYVWHNSPSPGDTSSWMDRSSRGVRLAFPNDPWVAHVSYREFGDVFDPAVGFTSRNGFRRLQPTIAYRPSFERSSIFRRMSWELYFEHLMDLDFHPETTNFRLSLLDILFETGEEFEMDVYRSFESLPFDFDIRRDGSIIVPAGRYGGWGFYVEGLTTGRRPLSARAAFSREQFWSGNRNEWSGRLTFRSPVGLQVNASYSKNIVSLVQGGFSTQLVRLSGDFDPTPFLFFTSSLQYDNLSGLVGLYGRIRWIVQPGSDLYLVYTHNWVTLDERWRTLEHGGAMKLSYALWF